jgi:hypothetical protein
MRQEPGSTTTCKFLLESVLGYSSYVISEELIDCSSNSRMMSAGDPGPSSSIRHAVTEICRAIRQYDWCMAAATAISVIFRGRLMALQELRFRFLSATALPSNNRTTPVKR